PDLYTLSLHDALPISGFSASLLNNNIALLISDSVSSNFSLSIFPMGSTINFNKVFHSLSDPSNAPILNGLGSLLLKTLSNPPALDRKSTRLNSSHVNI